MQFRERLSQYGPETLGDEELLAIILGTGTRMWNAHELAKRILINIGGLQELKNASPAEISETCGVGIAKASRIAAAMALAKRSSFVGDVRLGSPEDVFTHFQGRADASQESVWTVGLNNRNAIICEREIAKGGLNSISLSPRDVFTPLMRMRAAGCIVIHNHPSGDATPSVEDRETTLRLMNAGILLGIPVLDHIVVTATDFTSLSAVFSAEQQPFSCRMVDKG